MGRHFDDKDNSNDGVALDERNVCLCPSVRLSVRVHALVLSCALVLRVAGTAGR